MDFWRLFFLPISNPFPPPSRQPVVQYFTNQKNMENVAPSPKRARTEATIDDVQPPLPELADAALVSKLLSGSFSPTTAEEQCDAINKLREAINALRARLSKHNVDVSDDESELTIAASPEKDEKAAWLEQVEKDGLVLGNVDDLDPSEWQVPNQCIPVHVNVTLYDWTRLIEATKFDVIMMDPPWQLATANPTRGVALGYSQLTDEDIKNLPINSLQTEGYLLIWVINAKYKLSIDMFKKWGYDIVDEIVWVKSTVNRRLAKSHGYYLQHAKEVCLVGKKRTDPKNPPTYSKEPTIVYTTVPLEDENEEGEKAAQQQQEEEEEGEGAAAATLRPVEMVPFTPAPAREGVECDIIFSERRGQSQKPEEIYHIVESLVPNGRYLEIFARKNNLRDFWVSVGNEVTGTGHPKEDAMELAKHGRIANAKYGAGGSTSFAAAVNKGRR